MKRVVTDNNRHPAGPSFTKPDMAMRKKGAPVKNAVGPKAANTQSAFDMGNQVDPDIRKHSFRKRI